MDWFVNYLTNRTSHTMRPSTFFTFFRIIYAFTVQVMVFYTQKYMNVHCFIHCGCLTGKRSNRQMPLVVTDQCRLEEAICPSGVTVQQHATVLYCHIQPLGLHGLECREGWCSPLVWRISKAERDTCTWLPAQQNVEHFLCVCKVGLLMSVLNCKPTTFEQNCGTPVWY